MGGGGVLSPYLSQTAAGVTDELINTANIAVIIDAANPLKKRGPYKKQVE